MGIKLYEIEDDCDLCPLLKADLCSGGISVTPNGYREPPCCNMKEDTDLEEYVNEYNRKAMLYKQKKKERDKIKREKQEKQAISNRKRNYLKSYCYKEYKLIKDLKSQIKSYEELICKANIRSKTINLTNEMFRYEDRVTINPELELKLNKLRDDLNIAEINLKEKQKECRKSEAYRSIK